MMSGLPNHDSQSALPDFDNPFEMISSQYTLLTLVLQSARISKISELLQAKYGKFAGFFDNDPLVLDLLALKADDDLLDFARLLPLLTQYKLLPVAVRNGSTAQHMAAANAGLAVLPDSQPRLKASKPEVSVAEAVKQDVLNTPNTPQVSNDAPMMTVTHRPAKVIDRPVRSGQQVYAKESDLILLAGVAAGAEVLADGNIHVYGALHGRALAGVQGDENARIFVHAMHASLVSIAGVYRNIEENLPADTHGKAVQVLLQGTRLSILPLL